MVGDATPGGSAAAPGARRRDIGYAVPRDALHGRAEAILDAVRRSALVVGQPGLPAERLENAFELDAAQRRKRPSVSIGSLRSRSQSPLRAHA